MQFSLPSQKQDCINYVDKNEENLVAYFEKPTRSKKQNALFHTNIEIIATYTGYTPHKAKLIIKEWITRKWDLEMVIYDKTNKLDFRDYVSSKDLDTKDFSTLMNYVYEVGEAMWLIMKYPDDWLIEFATDLFS